MPTAQIVVLNDDETWAPAEASTIHTLTPEGVRALNGEGYDGDWDHAPPEWTERVENIAEVYAEAPPPNLTAAALANWHVLKALGAVEMGHFMVSDRTLEHLYAASRGIARALDE